MGNIIPVLPFLVVGAFLSIMAAVFVGSQFYEKRRTRLLSLVADELGLESTPERPDLLPRLERYAFFQQGRARKLWNVLEGKTDEEDLIVFDYRYTVGSGKNARTHKQTIVLFVSKLLHLPDFELTPRHFWHRFAKLLGKTEVSFADAPEFSRRYVVRGSEKPVRRWFGEPLLRYLEKNPGINCLGHGHELLFFRPGRRVAATNVKILLGEAYAFYALAKTAGEATRPADVSGD